LVQNASEAGYVTLAKIPEQNLDHLCTAAANKKKRSLSRAKGEGLLNSPKGEKRAALRIPDKVAKSFFL
jgi:hypothetical protein